MSKYVGSSSLLPHLAAAVGALIIYGLVLALAGDLLAPIGLEARSGIFFVPLYGAIVIYPAYRLAGWLGTFAALTATLLFFAIPLIGFWDNGGSNWFAFGGIVPASDGTIYYHDAQRLVEGFNFSFFSTRRPWLAGTLAPLLLLWNYQLHWVLATLVAFTAVCAFLLARELRHTHGPLAATVLITVVALFSREWLGFVYTEHLGLAFGLLALALLWRGATEQRGWLAAVGLGVLMLALLARAGTFFIIPALLLWVWLFFRKEGQRIPWQLLGSAVGVLVLVVGANTVLMRQLGPEESRPISNFAYVLYGIAAGGYGWNYVNVVHPEVWEMEEPELSEHIYELSFELLREHPENFFIAYGTAISSFFSIRMDNSVVGFIHIAQPFAQFEVYYWFSYAVRGVFLALLVLGCVWSILQRRTPHGGLLFWGFLGFLASLSFAPPIDSVRSFKYAASMPFIFALTAVGLVSALQWLRTRFPALPAPPVQPVAADPGGMRALLTVAVSGMAFLFGGALITQAITQPVSAAQPVAACEAGNGQFLVRSSPTGATTIFDPEQEPTTRFFEHLEDIEPVFLYFFQDGQNQPRQERLFALFDAMPRPFTLFRTVELEQGRMITVIMEPGTFEGQPDIVVVCGDVVEEPGLNTLPNNWYIFVREVHAVGDGDIYR